MIGKTRLPSDYIAEACSIIQGLEYTPKYLDNITSKGQSTIGRNPNTAENAKKNPSLDYTLDTVLQT